MTDFDYQKQAQDYYSKDPVIILGSGSSMAFGLPWEGELAVYIKENVDTSAIPVEDFKTYVSLIYKRVAT